MRVEELEAELRSGRLRPAYLLLGEEPLLRDEALAAIREVALGEAPVDFNFDRLEGDRTSAAALLDVLRTLPVLAPRRLVWLREPASGREARHSLLDVLPDVVRETAATSSVLVVTSATDSRRAAWVRAFREPNVVVSCDPPRGTRALLNFVHREAQRQGISLEGRAAQRLAERIGPQLLMLRNEIAKTALLAGEKGRVTSAHVAAAASDVADEPIWELTDAIGEGRVGDALATLGKMLSVGVPPPALLGSLAGHFRRLVRVRTGSSLEGPSFVVEKLQAQARRYPPTRLLSCLGTIHETDEILKGQGNIAPEIALERLVLALSLA